jgi:hypothetical protein
MAVVIERKRGNSPEGEAPLTRFRLAVRATYYVRSQTLSGPPSCWNFEYKPDSKIYPPGYTVKCFLRVFSCGTRFHVFCSGRESW